MGDEQKIHFYPLDVAYKEINGKSSILIYAKTVDKHRIILVDEFEPYFLIIPKEDSDISDIESKIKKISFEENGEKFFVTKTEVMDQKLINALRKVIKAYVNTPKGVPKIRKIMNEWDNIQTTNEYDIPFVHRYLMDKNIIPLSLTEASVEQYSYRARVPVFRIHNIANIGEDTIKDAETLSIDIETYYPEGGTINPDENPIVMIAFYSKGYRKVITSKRFNSKNDYVEFVDGESAIIERFREIVEERKPDFLVGYFSDGFDLPYIETRARKYKIKLDLGIDYSNLYVKRRVNEAGVFGIVHIDIFKFLRRILGRSIGLDNYSLDSVSEKLLGEKKISVDLKDLSRAWSEASDDLDLFAEYNLHDARLAFRLFDKTMPNIFEMVKIVGQLPFHVIRMSFSRLVEWYIMRRAVSLNYIIPNRPNYYQISERNARTFEGAFVKRPDPGIYSDILIYDFRSLYPSIISSHNIGLDTLDCDCCEDSEHVPETEHWFCRKKKGFIPALIENLINRRIRVKDMIRKNPDNVVLSARSETLKVLANSYYGYMGFSGARWYSFEAAEAVTSYGRHYIKDVIKRAEDAGFGVIYGDTDSVFIGKGDKSDDQVNSFIDGINRNLPGIMELEFEGHFNKGIFVQTKQGDSGAKKKYALLRDDGTIVIKGFETVRRNLSIIAKEFQEKVIGIILKSNDPKEAFSYAQSVINDVRDAKVPNEKFIIRTQLAKDIEDYESRGPHVMAAKRMQSLGKKVLPGMIISYIIAKGQGKINEKVRLPEEVEPGDYDPNYYISNQLLPAIDKIFEVLGYSMDDLSSDKSQSKLQGFFGD